MIWIAHTAVQKDSLASDIGVLDEVEGVTLALKELGLPHATISPEPSLLEFLSRLAKERDHSVIFNLVESFRGNPWGESWIASFYEALNLAYTGSPPETLALCLDKRRARAVLQHRGFPVAPGQSINELDFSLGGIEFPVIIKPACRDASEGLSPACVVQDRVALKQRAEQMFREGFHPLLLEKFIEGREFAVTVFQQDEWRVVSVFEVDFSGLPEDHPKILCFDAKWGYDTPAYHGTLTNPLQGDEEIKQRLSGIALAVAQELGLRDYGRVDFRCSTDGQPFIIDVNPNPDISHEGGFYRALASAGITFVEFVKQLVINAEKRRNEPAKVVEGG
jgi:D-alanine-D-alanine ligase